MSLDKEIVKALMEEIGVGFISESRMKPNRPTVTVDRDYLIQTVRLLVGRFNARLCTITAVDLGLDFELIYHMSMGGLVFNVKTSTPKEISEVPSVSSIIPGAISAEREIHDLFNIKFQGLPDPRPLIVPHEWSGVKTPLRKPASGIVAEYQKPTVETLMQQGQVFTMPATVKSHRQSLKLPEVKTTMNRPEALKEIHEIAREVGFDKRVGYDLQKMKLRY
ncbi:MAG: NADH-quinone oxidoreductase subunit C [Candidatus Bathyarchaeia archaeon]